MLAHILQSGGKMNKQTKRKQWHWQTLASPQNPSLVKIGQALKSLKMKVRCLPP